MQKAQNDVLFALARKSLDDAEVVWNKVGDKLTELANARRFLMEKSGVTTRIPGYPVIEDGVPIVDEFIALVADMRDSTKHLLQAIRARASQLQRVFYETSALLPCLAQVVEWQKGAVTEYLGDGVLALFKASPNRDAAVYSAHKAAKGCIDVARSVVNPLIRERYQLPDIDIGVGMAYSDAVVTLVGLENYQQPKVFGECVFRATKLACERNEIVIDKAMYLAWPTTKEGTLKFRMKTYGDIEGHQIL